MHIVNLIYKVSLDKIDQCLAAHIDYLDQQYALGNFLVSGPKASRTGGVILSRVSDRAALLEIVQQDPFVKNDLAEYELIEFVASKTCEELAFLKEEK